MSPEVLIDYGTHCAIAFSGPDAASFLQGLITQDTQTLDETQAKPTCVLNSKGGLLGYGHLYRNTETIWFLSVDADPTELVTHFNRYHIMEDLNITLTQPWRVLHQLGQDPWEIDGALMRSCTRFYTYPGTDYLMPADTSYSGKTVPDTDEHVEVLRISSGTPRFLLDMPRAENPMVFGLTPAISHTKGCYIGQETVAMTRDRGRPPRRLVVCHGKSVARPEPGPLFHNDVNIGALTSLAAVSPGAWIALATVKHQMAIEHANYRSHDGTQWTLSRISQYRDEA